MEVERFEAVVLGLGNVLWADEGFGVRAAEALHAAYAMPPGVEVVDGGTQGFALMDYVASTRRLLLLDAIDFGLPPGTLKVLRDGEVPAWGSVKMSPHQTGFEELLAVAQLRGSAPESIVLIGVQPERLDDFGGSLRPALKARIPEAVSIAVRELAGWGLAPHPRVAGDAERLNAPALALDAYESGRPSEAEACRIGDARVLGRRVSGER
jgi:hydrogenase maturation protease